MSGRDGRQSVVGWAIRSADSNHDFNGRPRVPGRQCGWTGVFRNRADLRSLCGRRRRGQWAGSLKVTVVRGERSRRPLGQGSTDRIGEGVTAPRCPDDLGGWNGRVIRQAGAVSVTFQV